MWKQTFLKWKENSDEKADLFKVERKLWWEIRTFWRRKTTQRWERRFFWTGKTTEWNCLKCLNWDERAELSEAERQLRWEQTFPMREQKSKAFWNGMTNERAECSKEARKLRWGSRSFQSGNTLEVQQHTFLKGKDNWGVRHQTIRQTQVVVDSNYQFYQNEMLLSQLEWNQQS